MIDLTAFIRLVSSYVLPMSDYIIVLVGFICLFGVLGILDALFNFGRR